MARFPPMPPADMSAELLQKHNAMDQYMSQLSGVVQYKDANGALIGPFAMLCYMPNVTEPYLAFFAELSKVPGLTLTARETAIIATGSVFKSKYELYAHKIIGKTVGLSDAQVESISEGLKPEGDNALNETEEIAFEVAIELAGGHHLGDTTWKRAESTLGKVGAGALIQYVSVYSFICLLLNGIDAASPA